MSELESENEQGEILSCDYGDWTTEQWVDWAYHLGLKLDSKIPFF